MTVVDDTYNASPAAMDMMLRTLAATPATGRRIAILGEMLELGDAARDLHERAAARPPKAASICWWPSAGRRRMAWLPARWPADCRAAASGGSTTRASAAARVAALIQRGDLVLVKGSRGTRMDILADALVAEGQG